MKVLVFGLGYSALHISQRLRSIGCEVTATVRTRSKAETLAAHGIDGQVFSQERMNARIAEEIRTSEAILVSIPPGEHGDPVLASFSADIFDGPKLRWIGYLSTVGVYGDHAGGWVDENTPALPGQARTRLRLQAEQAWIALGARIFRLSGIYGPDRNQLVQLAAGTARRVVKPGQIFNRIHVADIAAVIEAALMKSRPGGIYNVSDDEPAPPQDVVEFAATLCGLEPPPAIPFEDAALSAMARSFYNESRRVRNSLLRHELGVILKYPTYREGLTALRAAGEGPAR
jgi:nucleoside-diphosphate-sugar epimerase